MIAQLVSPGVANLIVFVVLALFGVIAWYFMRRNLRGIDFDEVPSGPALRRTDGQGPDEGTGGGPGDTPASPDRSAGDHPGSH